MIFNWLSVFVGIAYTVLGIFVMIEKFFVVQLDSTTSYALGILLIVYGGFRTIRAILKLKNNRNEK